MSTTKTSAAKATGRETHASSGGRVRPRLIVPMWRRSGLDKVLVLLVITLLAVWPRFAAAQGPFESWAAQDTATGDWGGARTALKASGITPAAKYTADVLGNPTGGESQDLAYAAKLKGSLAFDLETLLGAQGLKFMTSASWNQGRNLSSDHIGNTFAVSQIFAGDGVRLLHLFLEQSLWQDRVEVRLGRLSVGGNFATSPVYDYYVSDAINSNPESVKINTPSFTSDSYAQWGTQATVRPADDLYLSLGAYNADPRVKEDSSHGVDFTFNPEDGVLSLLEFGFLPNHGPDKVGLPGRYALGGYYDSSDYDRLDDPASERSGNYGFYIQGEQMLTREGESDSRQGLTAWSILTFAPRQDINKLPYAAFGGLAYRGLLPQRDDDISALGLYYGRFSDDLPGQDYEVVLEVNHRFQFAPWLYLTPDFQYIFNPGGTGDISDAVVLGFELNVDF